MEQLRGARRFRSPLIVALVGPLWFHPKGLVAFAARTEFEKEVDSCGRSRGEGREAQGSRVASEPAPVRTMAHGLVEKLELEKLNLQAKMRVNPRWRP